MSEPLRWGILGTGNIAAKFAAQLNATDHGQLVATGSRTLANATAFAGQHGGQGHGSYEQLVADPQVEAIYNSLPNSLHASWSIAGMQAGKHVLCEKVLIIFRSTSYVRYRRLQRSVPHVVSASVCWLRYFRQRHARTL